MNKSFLIDTFYHYCWRNRIWSVIYLQISLPGGRSVTSLVGLEQSWSPSHVTGQMHQHLLDSYTAVPPFSQTVDSKHCGGPSIDG